MITTKTKGLIIFLAVFFLLIVGIVQTQELQQNSLRSIIDKGYNITADKLNYECLHGKCTIFSELENLQALRNAEFGFKFPVNVSVENYLITETIRQVELMSNKTNKSTFINVTDTTYTKLPEQFTEKQKTTLTESIALIQNTKYKIKSVVHVPLGSSGKFNITLGDGILDPNWTYLNFSNFYDPFDDSDINTTIWETRIDGCTTGGESNTISEDTNRVRLQSSDSQGGTCSTALWTDYDYSNSAGLDYQIKFNMSTSSADWFVAFRETNANFTGTCAQIDTQTTKVLMGRGGGKCGSDGDFATETTFTLDINSVGTEVTISGGVSRTRNLTNITDWHLVFHLINIGGVSTNFIDVFDFNSTCKAGCNLPPTIPVLNSPTNNSLVLETPVLNWLNSTDSHGDAITYILEVYNDSALTQIAYTNNSITETESPTQDILPELLGGTYYWRVRSTDGVDNDSFSQPFNFQLLTVEVISEMSTFNDSVAEASIQSFNTNITYNNLLVEDVEAALVYNGTSYSATKTVDVNGTKNFTRTITIPSTTFDKTDNFYWNFTLSWYNGTTTYNNTANYNQVVNYTNFTIRDSIVQDSYLNFIFKDEVDNTEISASVAESTFIYAPQSNLLVNKTFTYSNSSENSFYNFSFRPSYQGITAQISFTYESANYPARLYQETLTLSNETTTKTLFLLNLGNGTTVTFQVINEANQPLEDVKVEVTRNSETVEIKNTDAAGIVTFFLDSDLSYTLSFTKSGFEDYETTFVPTQSAYTVSMSQTTAGADIGFLEGVSWSFQPDNDTLQNQTTYNFSFAVTSIFRNLDSAGFILENGSGTFLNTTSCTGITGCSASILTNTENHTSINMDWFIVINGTYLNGTRTWEVQEFYVGVGALVRFFEDLDNLGSGFNPFTKAIFAFFFIFIFTGAVTYISGLTSPLAILGVIFAATAFFDIAGMLPTINNIPFLISALMGIIWFGAFMWEFGR